jgi:hypothetical protein
MSFRAGCVSDGIKNKHLPRINTEKDRSRSICHGLTRKKTEAEAFATELHGKQNKPRKEDISFRAGCVSDCINILFWEGPFDRLRDPKILAECLHLP